MPFSTIFFDLDGTLYGDETGVWPLLAARISQYMNEIVGIPKREIPDLRADYLQNYGTTLRGLHIHHKVDADEYLRFVHDVPLEEHLAPNKALDRMLERLPQKKWIFTNASSEHAVRVLDALQIRRHFRDILDVKGMSYRSKPEAGVYALAMELAGEEQASNCLFLDDRAENLAPARALGTGTVLVGTREPHPSTEYSIPKVEDLIDALPGLVE